MARIDGEISVIYSNSYSGEDIAILNADEISAGLYLW